MKPVYLYHPCSCTYRDAELVDLNQRVPEVAWLLAILAKKRRTTITMSSTWLSCQLTRIFFPFNLRFKFDPSVKFKCILCTLLLFQYNISEVVESSWDTLRENGSHVNICLFFVSCGKSKTLTWPPPVMHCCWCWLLVSCLNLIFCVSAGRLVKKVLYRYLFGKTSWFLYFFRGFVSVVLYVELEEPEKYEYILYYTCYFSVLYFLLWMWLSLTN